MRWKPSVRTSLFHLPTDASVVAFLEQVVKDALVDAEKNNIVRFDEYMMFVWRRWMRRRYTLSQSQKRYSFLEGVYNSVKPIECSDGVESRREETAGDHSETKECEAEG